MNYAKILAVYAVFFFFQPSLGMISPTSKTASETEQLFFPDTLIAKSKYLKNIQTDANAPIIEEKNKKYLVLDKQFFPTEGTNQQLINELSDLYENTQLSSLSNNTQQDHNQLTILANLDHTLIEKSNPAKKLLATLLADTIISCPIEQLSVFNTLNSDLTKKITLKIIKNNKLDTQLFEPYQKTLPKQAIKLLDPQNEANDAQLIFFNDEQMIYGIINKKSKLFDADHYEQIVITDRNSQTIQTIPLAKALPGVSKKIETTKDSIFISPNGTYCLLETCILTTLENDPILGKPYLDYTYKLINNITGDIESLPHLINQAWCFASDNILCSTDKFPSTTTITLNVLNLSQKHIITTAEIPLPNGPIDQIQCHIKYRNDHMQVIALVSYANGTAFICDNHTAHQIEYRFQNDPIRLMCLQNSGNKGFIITKNAKLLTIDLIAKKINSNQINLLQYQANNLQAVKTTNNDTFLTTVFNHVAVVAQAFFDGSIDNFKTYGFTIQNTANTWNRKGIPDDTTIIISNKGDTAIEIPPTSIVSSPAQSINLYDNNMSKSSSYWNTNSTDGIPAHTKLLVACLLDKLFKKVKSNWLTNSIQLDEAESRVYTQDCPQAVQAILKTLFTIKLSYQPQIPESVSANTPQHNYFSSFTNYTNSMYKTVTDTISQYKTQLILGTAVIGSAIGLTTLYKYLMDKQPQ